MSPQRALWLASSRLLTTYTTVSKELRSCHWRQRKISLILPQLSLETLTEFAWRALWSLSENLTAPVLRLMTPTKKLLAGSEKCTLLSPYRLRCRLPGERGVRYPII